MELNTANYIGYIRKVAAFRESVFEKIAKKNSDSVWLKASLKNIKKVVIINSASRSGSSLLVEILKKMPGIYSLSGESVPFYKINGLSSDYLPSDEIPAELENETGYLFGMSRDFLSDLSMPLEANVVFGDSVLLEQYVDDLILRFPLEWPSVSFSYETFKKLAFEAIDVYSKAGSGFSVKEFYLELLSYLRREYKDINPYYYDIPADMVQKKFPELKIPCGPPNNVFTIEEPPFILLSPSKKVIESDHRDNILLLKSSADCYRMRFIERLFPSADLKIIYLTRNPAASINGLYDGWLHRGFFSHNLEFLLRSKSFGAKPLEISGYSERYEWGKWWWNYDLPPGWQDYTARRLEEVCGFQWYLANKAVREYLDKSTRDYCLVRYENLLLSKSLRKKEIEKIVDFIGLKRDAVKKAEVNQLPVVQATEKPENYRWKKKRDIILPVINSLKISEMCASIGYDKNKMEEWI